MAGSAINWESLAREDAIGPIVSSGRYRLDSPSTVTGSPTFAMAAAGQSAEIRVFLPSGKSIEAPLAISGTTAVSLVNQVGKPFSQAELALIEIEVTMPYGQNLLTTDEPNGSPSAPFATLEALAAAYPVAPTYAVEARVGTALSSVGYRYVGPGTGVGAWAVIPQNASALHTWTGFGDSLAANPWAFSSTAILLSGNTLVGQSNYASGVNSFGYAGKRSDEIIQYIPAVLASGAKNVIVIVGANDRLQNVSVAVFYANLRTIYERLIAGGACVFGSYLAPEDTKPLATYPYNCAIRKAANEFGIDVLSPFDAVTNPVDGKWVSGKSGDGTHPLVPVSGDCGAVAASQIENKTFPRLYATSNIGGIVANGCFTNDTNSDGTPDGWAKQTTGNMVPTVSLVAADVGNAARITFSAASGSFGDGAILKTQAQFAVIPGNKLLVTGACKINSISGASAAIGVTFLTAAYEYLTERFVLPDNRLVGKKLFATAEITVPVNAVFAIVTVRASALSYPCSGEVDFERIQVIDLTAIGL